MPRFSAHLTQLFTEHPFAERFAAAAERGFDACEFRSPFEFDPVEVAAWSRDAALPVILFNGPPGDWSAGDRGIAAIPGREAEFGATVELASRYLDALDTPMLHVMAGMPPADASPDACRATFVANLRTAARRLATSGRTVLIEALNPIDNPGYFLIAQDEAHAVRDDVGEPNLFVQFDCYHARMNGEDVDANLRGRIDAIRHIQIAGAPGRHEPDTGAFDYAPVFSLVDALGYAGWIGCEYVPKGRTEDGLGWMRTLASPPSPSLGDAPSDASPA